MSRDKDKLTRRELFKTGATGAGLWLGSRWLPRALGGDPNAWAAPAAALPRVPRRVLGKTGKKIPILLFGAAGKLDTRFDPKLAEALRFGVDYVDTAAVYGNGSSERAVGSFHTQAHVRDKLWITSKSPDHDPEGFARSLDQSLARLKTDHVQMFFLHALRDGRFLSAELARVVEKLKKAGKIHHFGFSCHSANVAELLQKAATVSWVDAVMFRYNFRSYGDKALNQAMDRCAQANVGLIAMKTQGSEASFAKSFEKFRQEGKFSKHQAVLKAVWDDARLSAAVSHMDTLEKLKENTAAALDKDKLTRRERDELERYAQATRALACEGCDHLCNAAVDAPVRIGDTLRFLMYHDAYGEPDKARALFRGLPAGAQRLERVDFGPANAACPHGVDVAWHMKRAAQVLGETVPV